MKFRLFIAPGMEVEVMENPVMPMNTVAFVAACPGGRIGCQKCRGMVSGSHISFVDLNEKEKPK